MRFIFLCLFILFSSCKKEDESNQILDINTNRENIDLIVSDSILDVESTEKKDLEIGLSKNIDTLKKDLIDEDFSSEFVNLKTLSNDFVYDIKYATADNFLKQAVYDCPECFLRKETALALIKANESFIEKGYKILIYDCYRPLDVQKKMWAILPGTNYVANPKKGSKHNRGAAVDLTLIDKTGKIVDMGTPFDFFGKEAHHTFTKLPKEVLDNRKLLKETLNQFNFRHISSEWWHYEYRPEMFKPVSNFKWACE